MHRHPTDRTPTTTRLAVAAATLALLLAACSAKGGERDAVRSGDDVATTTTTTASTSDPDATTTTTAKATTTTEGRRPASITEAQIRAILPTAAAIGLGYTAKDPSDDDSDDAEDDASDKAVRDACPAAAALEELDNGKDDQEITVDFEGPSNKEISVSVDPDPSNFTEAKVDTAIAAIAGCKEIHFEDDGSSVRMTMFAERDDRFGDFGVHLKVTATVGTPLGEIPVTIDGVIFVVDGLGGSVNSTSGIDEATLKPVPADDAKIPKLAAKLADDLAGLD